MYIKNDCSDNTGLFLNNRPVRVFLGKITVSDPERKQMIDLCQKIWNDIFSRCRNPDFFGLVRFDLVPHLSGLPEGSFVGDLSFSGIYEVNCHSPEDLAAFCAISETFSALDSVNPVRILVERLRTWSDDKKIGFLSGSCLVKDSWRDSYVVALRSHGLDLCLLDPCNPKTFLWNGPVYRWGDYRETGCTQYPKDSDFRRWLLNLSEKGLVANPVFPSHYDPSNKFFLLGSSESEMGRFLGNNRQLLSREDFDWSLDHVHGQHRYCGLVLKPDNGASGDGVYFGNNYKTDEWSQLCFGLIDQHYSLWERKNLPRTVVDGTDYAFDFNPTFWVENGHLHYSHSLVRMCPWDKYLKHGILNVSKGAGFFAHPVY
ncbi:MAG: hypothetical protein KC736_02495 [Candidatus Moranbacteria bacterium]|nr:hypothetical protein [Candidatus Moranbacteria bacterium]